MVALPPTSPLLTPTQHNQLLELLISPDLSLNEVAAKLGVPLSRLSLYLATSDEGHDLIALLQNLCATRARLAATALLPRAITALKHNLNDYDTLVRAGTATDTHHDRARRAAHLLLRIASFHTSRSTGPRPTPTSHALPLRAPAHQPGMQPDRKGGLRATALSPSRTQHPATTLHPEEPAATHRASPLAVQPAITQRVLPQAHNGNDHTLHLETPATHNRSLQPTAPTVRSRDISDQAPNRTQPPGRISSQPGPARAPAPTRHTPAQSLRAAAGAPNPLLATPIPP